MLNWLKPIKSIRELPYSKHNHEGDVIYVEETEEVYLWNPKYRRWDIVFKGNNNCKYIHEFFNYG